VVGVFLFVNYWSSAFFFGKIFLAWLANAKSSFKPVIACAVVWILHLPANLKNFCLLKLFLFFVVLGVLAPEVPVVVPVVFYCPALDFFYICKHYAFFILANQGFVLSELVFFGAADKFGHWFAATETKPCFGFL